MAATATTTEAAAAKEVAAAVLRRAGAEMRERAKAAEERQAREREIKRAAEARQAAAERAPWSEMERDLLAKALVKFPSGVPKRWEKVTEHINHFAGNGRSADEVTAIVKVLRSKAAEKAATVADIVAEKAV